jgi:hypothetical protein
MKELASSLFPFDAGVVAVSAMACINSIKSKRRTNRQSEIVRRMAEVRKKWWGKKYQVSREEAEQEVEGLEFFESTSSWDWTMLADFDLQRALELISAVMFEEEGSTVFLSAEDAALVNSYRKKQDGN